MTGMERMIGVAMVLGCTCLEALGQVAFKRAADKRAGPAAGAMAGYQWILLGWSAYIVEAYCWSAVLYFLDVSVAHPLSSFVFVVVAIASRFFLHERIEPRRWMGIALILGGTVLVALN